jgi:LysR family carnitine catabolism transcriptional activator
MNVQNIKYRQLKAFAMVVETGSFHAAADRMAVAQPSLSALIRELESDVGVSLLERTTRSCTLTSAGQAFYEDMMGALQHLESAYRHIQEVGLGTRGTLNLAAMPSLAAGIATQALGLLRQQHPAVRIQLTEGSNAEVLNAVRQGRAEVGLGSLWAADEALDFQELMQDRLMVVAPEGHPSLQMPPTLALAEAFDLILMSAGPTQHALNVRQIQRPAAFQVEHLATALALVRHGLGICLLPSSALGGSLSVAGLVCRAVDDALAVRRLGVIVRSGHRPSTPARVFTRLLAEVAKAGRAGGVVVSGEPDEQDGAS